MAWYTVRCIFQLDDSKLYEERITLWSASSLSTAIERAETEAAEYASNVGATFLELAQSYEIPDEEIDVGSELFSLIRESALDPSSYLSTFFDTGAEKQQRWP